MNEIIKKVYKGMQEINLDNKESGVFIYKKEDENLIILNRGNQNDLVAMFRAMLLTNSDASSALRVAVTQNQEDVEIDIIENGSVDIRMN